MQLLKRLRLLSATPDPLGYTLYVYRLEQGWQLEVFRQFAAYLQREGLPTRVRTASGFWLRGPWWRRRRTTLHHAVAVLQHRRSGSFWVLDLHDWSTPFDFDFQAVVADVRCQRYLKGQFEDGIFEQGDLTKIRPWTYFEVDSPVVQARVDALRERPRSLDGLYFKGTMTIPERESILEHLRGHGVLCPDTPHLDLPQYLEEASRYRIMLGLPGMAKLCHREIEGFGIGTPVLMPRLRIRLHEPLVPDVHYIAADVEGDTEDLAHMADRIAARYRQVRDDATLLSFVASNAMRWYDANVRFTRSLPLTRELLGI
jgi:hypothetical protein